MNCIGLLLGTFFEGSWFGPTPLVVWRSPNSTRSQKIIFRPPGASVGSVRRPGRVACSRLREHADIGIKRRSHLHAHVCRPPRACHTPAAAYRTCQTITAN